MADTDAANRTRAQAQDAYELACYVIENGVTDKDGDLLPVADIAVIESTAALLGIIDVAAGTDGSATPAPITNAQWNAFEQAYYRLAIATKPVTAETLRNTLYVAGGPVQQDGAFSWCAWWCWLCGSSPAQRFTRWLWVVTIIITALVAVTEWRVNALGMNADANAVKVQKDLWQWIQPWAYGALGSCACLLRSGHYYIYARSFDLRRTPEYFNRILLGAISGGAIILFADYLVSQDDTFTHIGTTALGFVAGYSTDFLFSTVERVVTAIFPKVDVETVPQDSSPKKPKANGGNGGAGDGGDGAAGGQGSQGDQGANTGNPAG
jgi:hypothetical protein